MSSLRFPTIQTKKSLVEEQDYNFINKDKKKKVSSNNPLELIDELKRKIEQQKKQIENRNMTIQGLQRNFESLSVIVKNQKAQSAALRAELDNLRHNSENGDKRASEYHQKCIVLQKQTRSLKDELKSLKKTHSQCSQYVTLTQQLKKRIGQLQEVNQRLHNKIIQNDAEKKSLQIELTKFKSIQKEKRLLNQRIIDLEDEIKRITDTNNSLNYRYVATEEQLGRMRNQISSRDKKIQELKMRVKDYEKQQERLEFDGQFLKKQVARLNSKLEQAEAMMENKQLYNKIKMQEEQKLKLQSKKLLQQYNQLQTEYKKVLEESQEKTGMLNFAHSQIENMKQQQQQLSSSFKIKEANYQHQVQKLMNSIKDLHQQLNMSTGQSSELNKQLREEMQRNSTYNQKISNLHNNIDQMNRKMQEHHEKFGHYLKLIAKNEPDVIITNQREMDRMQNGAATTIVKLKGDISQLEKNIAEWESNALCQNNNLENMRNYIKNLEEEISSKSQELIEKSRLLRKYQDQEEELNRMVVNQRRLSEKLKLEAEAQIMERMRELQSQKLKSQKEIEDQRRRLQKQLQQEKQKHEQKLRHQRQQSQKYSRLLQQYKDEERKLKEMMSKEQLDISRLQQEKQEEIKRLIRQKEEEIEKEKKNNKMLWSDNKKLKDLENKLKEDSRKMLEEKEAAKRQEIQRLKRQLQRKYKDEMGMIKNQESNSNELKKILAERNSQFKDLTENHNKLKSESEFYKNRNKQLQALVSRMEKQHKDKTQDLERENKSNKQVIEVLDKKIKEAEANLLEAQKQQKRELKYLYDQIQDMKKAAKNQRIEEKVALVHKSMADLDTSLKTLMNTMSCNYCVEVVKDCVRLECGHIYCKKCKGGYEPNCGECKKKGNATSDKMIDDSVSKAQYMRILINTIKDDLSKISQ